MLPKIMSLMALGVVAAAAYPAFADLVYLESDQRVGRGVTRARADGCFIIAPEHVVADAQTILAVGEGGARTYADLELVRFGNDIAVIRLQQENPDIFCPSEERWEDGTDVEQILVDAVSGTIRSRSANGGMSLVPVRITDIGPRHLAVAPTDMKDRIHQGLSGSVLIIEGRPVGMLMMAETTQSGIGTIYRWDAIDGLISGFFRRLDSDVGCAIAIDSDPTGARITVGGRSFGRTPKVVKLDNRNEVYELNLLFRGGFVHTSQIDCTDTRRKSVRLADLPTHDVNFALEGHDSAGARISDCYPSVTVNGTDVLKQSLSVPEGIFVAKLAGHFECRDRYGCDAVPQEYELEIRDSRFYRATFVWEGDECFLRLATER